jgi:hypothetical protein
MVLTPELIKAISKPGSYCDDRGLYVQIAKGGTKSWVYIYMRGGRRRRMGLGSIIDTSLDEARALRDEARRQLKRGIDPIAYRRDQSKQQLDMHHWFKNQQDLTKQLTVEIKRLNTWLNTIIVEPKEKWLFKTSLLNPSLSGEEKPDEGGAQLPRPQKPDQKS